MTRPREIGMFLKVKDNFGVLWFLINATLDPFHEMNNTKEHNLLTKKNCLYVLLLIHMTIREKRLLHGNQ